MPAGLQGRRQRKATSKPSHRHGCAARRGAARRGHSILTVLFVEGGRPLLAGPLPYLFMTRLGERQAHGPILLAGTIMGQPFIEYGFETTSARQVAVAVLQKHKFEPTIENALNSQHDT